MRIQKYGIFFTIFTFFFHLFFSHTTFPLNMYQQDIGCRIILVIRAVRLDTTTIGEPFNNLHHSQVRKIGNGTSRPSETFIFKRYIDKIKQDSPAAIALLIDTMRTDTDMAASTAQGSVHDGGLVMIEWCKMILETEEFSVVGVPPLPVTPPHTPPPPLQQPVTADDAKTAEAERLSGEQGVSGLDQLHGAADASNSWRSSTPLWECDELPSSPRSRLKK